MVRTNEEVKKEIIDHLFWDNRVDASNVTVDVSAGEVSLSGTVVSDYARQAALDDASLVAGVVSVGDNLQVRAVEPTRGYEGVEDHLRNLLEWDANLSGEDIYLEYKAGTVTLTGSVDKLWKKNLAERLSRSVTSVYHVVNKISVVPTEDNADEAIAEMVERALERNSMVNENAINVKVARGVVTLVGTVPSWHARNAAFETAMYTSGVVDVHDQLAIQVVG
jgi:osmotically-inducible protein OsmY